MRDRERGGGEGERDLSLIMLYFLTKNILTFSEREIERVGIIIIIICRYKERVIK